MNRGFSILECIIYIGLLSLLSFTLLSSLSPSLFEKPTFEESDYQFLLKNYYE